MKAGIIGLGAIAPMHIEALKERGVEIVAVCDVDRKKCDDVNREYSLNARGYEDYRKCSKKRISTSFTYVRRITFTPK